MILRNNLLLGILMVLCIACGGKTSGDSNQEEQAKIDVSELTYLQLYQLVLEKADGTGMDFHGDGYGMQAAEHLTLSMGEKCGKNGCGSIIIASNSEASSVKFVVKANFSLPGNPLSEMIREYKVGANQSTVIGCSHLCYNGNSYEFSREIIGAVFDTE